MKQLLLFRILTYILLPIAAMFAFLTLLLLISALANPSILLLAFIIGSFVIYVFVSLRFLNRGIDSNQPCPKSLRDWIRVNAYVSVFLGSMFVINSLSIFMMSDASLRQYIAEYLSSQPNVPAMLNENLFLSVMKAFSYFMIFMGVVLLAHIFVQFRLLRKFGYLFDNSNEKA
jgi:hypothetical protein